jgi:argininosuccinate synthase
LGYSRTVDPVDAPDQPTYFVIHFENGIPVKVVTAEKEVSGSVELFKFLNKLGYDNGIGRADIIENRFSMHIHYLGERVSTDASH